MTGSVNKAILVGAISPRGCELRATATGTVCCVFMLACPETWSDGKEHTMFLPVGIVGRRAEALSAMEPGSVVCIEGKLLRRKTADRWETIVMAWDVVSISTPPPAPPERSVAV
jgi:single-stranded DNA-binding protein